MNCFRCHTIMYLDSDESYHCPKCQAVCSYDYGEPATKDNPTGGCYPYGEKKGGRIEEKARKIAKLVEEKNKAYGNSFGESEKILKVLYPNGIKTENYKDILTVARILDKIFRIANQKNYAGENPYEDIAGYALLASTNR